MLIHQEYFEDVSSVDVQHNAGRQVSVQLIVDGEKRADLIRSASADHFDPMNKLKIIFGQSITGRIQIYTDEISQIGLVNPDVSAAVTVLGFHPTYGSSMYEYNKKVRDVAAAGYENGEIIHPSVTVNYNYNAKRKKVISKQVVVRDKDGNTVTDRAFAVKEEKVNSYTKIIHTYEVES